MYQSFQQGGQPSYKEIARGVGIDPRELDAIKKVAFQVYQSGVKPMAKDISEELNNNLEENGLPLSILLEMKHMNSL